ncbi:hypothetical protein BG004_006037, partial [Podila humilis]
MTVETPIPGANNGPTHIETNDKKTIKGGLPKTCSDISHSSTLERRPTTYGSCEANPNKSSDIEIIKNGNSDNVLDFPAGNLGSAPVRLNLPTDHIQTGDHSFAGSTNSTNLEEPLKSQLLKLSNVHDTDVATVVLVAWIITLSRLSGQESIDVGVSSSEQMEHLTPSTRKFDLSGNPNTSELLERVKLVNGSMHRSVNNGIPLSQACFFSHTGEQLDHTVFIQSYLELHLVQNKGNVSTNIRYAADRYNRETIEKYAGYLQAVFLNMVVHRTRPTNLFDIVSSPKENPLPQTEDATEFTEAETHPPEPSLFGYTDIAIEDDDDNEIVAFVGADPRATSAQDYVSRQGEIETELAKMSAELLNVSHISRDDDFFELGGHSIMAMRLMNSVATKFGPQVPMSSFFAAPTLHGLAEAVSCSISQGISAHTSIPQVSRSGPQELSFAQQRLWFLVKTGGAGGNYHISRALRLHGPLDHAALQNALDTLYARHEALRSVFPTVDDGAKVEVLPSHGSIPFEVIDLRHDQDREHIAYQALIQEGCAPFYLERGPLVRVKLIQLGEEEHTFLLTVHHIVSDGWSMGVMFRELNSLYEAYSTSKPNPLTPLSIQYMDYAAWQRLQLAKDTLKDQADYWRKTLANAPVCIELPTDRPRPPKQSFACASVPIRFNSKLTRNLNTLSQKHGVTMFMTVVAAWSAVLARLSGQDDIVIGSPSANRNHPQVEQLIGFFVSTLALRIDL